MKTVFITTDSFAAQFISTRLHSNGNLDALIIEKGSSSITAKISREINSVPWWKVPVKFLDFAAIYIYSKMSRNYILKNLLLPNRINGFPEDIPVHQVGNASGSQCLSILQSLEPDLLIVYGTSILKQEVISIAKRFTLNIHGGIVPQYRNVHSDFWAMNKRDFKNIGTSIIHLDSGIDTGDVALQESVEVSPKDTLFSIKRKNIELAARLILNAVEMVKNDTLIRTPQRKVSGGFHKTPGFMDFLRWVTSLLKNKESFS